MWKNDNGAEWLLGMKFRRVMDPVSEGSCWEDLAATLSL